MKNIRKLTTIAIAALAIATGLATSTPASAQALGGVLWGHPGWGHGGGVLWGHPGWGGGYNRGFGYGAGLAGAALGGAVVGGMIANSNRCYHNYPRYDAWGRFIGYTTASVPCS